MIGLKLTEAALGRSIGFIEAQGGIGRLYHMEMHITKDW